MTTAVAATRAPADAVTVAAGPVAVSGLTRPQVPARGIGKLPQPRQST